MPIITQNHVYYLYKRSDGGYQWQRVPFPGIGKFVGLDRESTDEHPDDTSVVEEDSGATRPRLINDVIQEKVAELREARRKQGRDNSVKWKSVQVVYSAVVGGYLSGDKFYLRPR